MPLTFTEPQDEASLPKANHPDRALLAARSLMELGAECFHGKDFPSGGRGNPKFKSTDPLCVALFGNAGANTGSRSGGSALSRTVDDGPARKLLAVRSLMELASAECYYGRDFPSTGRDGSKFKHTNPLCVALLGNGNDNNRRRRNGRQGPDLD